MTQAKKIVKHSFIYATGNMMRQLVSFLMLPVYTSFLTPADYGVVGLLVFMVSLIELLFGGHMFQAIPKFYYEKNDPNDRKELLSTALIITTVISSLAVVLVVLFSSPISQLLFGEKTYYIPVCMFASLILTHALENYALVYIRIRQKPWLFVIASLVKLVMQLSLNILFVVYLKWGVMGVAVSTMISSILFSSALTIYTIRLIGIRVKRDVAKILIKFSWPLWIGGIAGLYIGSSNRYYIRIFSNLDDVGLFELAAKFGAIITFLIWTPFSQFWQTERFNIYRNDNPAPIYQGVFKFVTIILMVSGLGISILAPPVIKLMADNTFYDSNRAVPFLVFASVFQCLTIFNNFSFLVKDKTTWMSRNNYITAAIVSIFYFILIPLFGFVGAAISLSVAFLIQYLIVHYSAKKHYDMGLNIVTVFYSLAIACSAVAIAQFGSYSTFFSEITTRFIILIVAITIIVLPLLSKEEILRAKEMLFAGSK